METLDEQEASKQQALARAEAAERELELVKTQQASLVSVCYPLHCRHCCSISSMSQCFCISHLLPAIVTVLPSAQPDSMHENVGLHCRVLSAQTVLVQMWQPMSQPKQLELMNWCVLLLPLLPNYICTAQTVCSCMNSLLTNSRAHRQCLHTAVRRFQL